LLDTLGVEWQDSDMSFSVQDARSGLEYNGTSLNALFAQRRNLVRPSFHRMIRDILRFNREASTLLAPGAAEPTLQEFLDDRAYSKAFVDHYIIPMGAAIWSAKPETMRQMPAPFFARFFHNHGMLSVNDRPVWRVIKGGSKQYVDRLIRDHRDRIRTRAPVQSVQRMQEHVTVRVTGAEPEHFDHVFLACHSDQALAMLADPSEQEASVLGAMAYQKNEAVLHTDASIMPRRRRAWAAWNYHLLEDSQERVAVTYNMNILQGLDAPVQFCVSLNNTAAIDPDRVIQSFDYEHPVFTTAAVAAQQRHADINGEQVNGFTGRTWYCGAYWRYGFHEDGVVSALTALENFNQGQADAERNLRRAS
jgi:predicted NAD/FAD-binding protein